MSCSRLTYSDLTPFARAFSCMTQRMREVFIVPGVPATRTVLPFGMPPPRARSSPSTYVWRRGTSTSISGGRRSPRYKVMASSLSREIFTGDKKVGRHAQSRGNAFVAATPCAPRRDGQAGRGGPQAAPLGAPGLRQDRHGGDVAPPRQELGRGRRPNRAGGPGSVPE